MQLTVVLTSYSGCFCNVGGCQEALGLSAADVEYNYAIGRVCSDSGHDIINGKPTGASSMIHFPCCVTMILLWSLCASAM